MDIVTLGMARLDARRVAQVGHRGNGMIWGLGDSITANGRTVTTNGEVFGGTSYLMHAILLSGGRLRYGGIAATGGYTSAQIIATHLPTVVAARPQFCVVHAGTNDTSGGLTEAQTRANLTRIADSLLAVGTTPILTTMLPKHTEIGISAARLQRLSLFVKRLARERSVPCVDWRTLLAEPTQDDWIAYSGGTGTYNADDTHPNAVGAQVIGQALVDAINPVLPPLVPYLPTANINSGMMAPTSSNALALTDGNADGIPDGWATSGTVPAGSTFTLTDLTEGRGKWFNLTRTTVGGGDLIVGTTASAVVPGNRMGIAMRLKAANVVANASSFDVRFIDSPAGAVDMWGLKVWPRDVGSTFLAGEFVVPATVTSGKLQVQLRGPCTVSIGQYALIDLSAQGLV